MRGRATTAVTAAVSDSSVSPVSPSSTTVAVNAEPSLRRRRPSDDSDWHSVEGEETQVA
jgi:hypothetical protein